MNQNQTTVLFLALGILLLASRLLGELAKKCRQPSVMGEILAGIVLGPTIFGMIFPTVKAFLFPLDGINQIVLQSITTIGATLFLFVAGMELDLGRVFSQGKTAIIVGITGITVPFILVFILSWLWTEEMGIQAGQNKMIFCLFLATALSISALPVIAKTLMDLGIYRSDTGMVIIAAAVLNDLLGWIIFAFVLGSLGTHGSHLPLSYTVGLIVVFVLFMLTGGRWLIHRSLPWIQAQLSWPSGVMGFVLAIALLSASFTEWIGIHTIFGAFLAGIAIGDSYHLRERTRSTLDGFISSFFSPLFFASIGLYVNFFEHFDWFLTLVIILLACLGKIAACFVSARLCSMASSEAWAVGFAMNSRGAMEIILGLVAFQAGIIEEPIFVSLVVMAICTSMASGPLLRMSLKLPKKRSFTDYMTARTFIQWLQAQNAKEAIAELMATLPFSKDEVHKLTEKIWACEEIMPSGLGNGLAIPHGRLKGIPTPLIALGLSQAGIDFNSPDGELARVIFLILTPQDDTKVQLEIIADIAKTFKNYKVVHQALHIENFTELRAFSNTSH